MELTGYRQEALEAQLEKPTDIETFFAEVVIFLQFTIIYIL
jgi:hypothetical protein